MLPHCVVRLAMGLQFFARAITRDGRAEEAVSTCIGLITTEGYTSVRGAT